MPPVVSISEAKLSPSTKMFLSELNKEVTAQEKDFTPSENLVRNYKLSMTDGKYFIGGMLKTDGTANETETIGLGIKIGTKAGNIWTVRIPILQLEKLKTTKGIIYIQVDEQVTIKQ